MRQSDHHSRTKSNVLGIQEILPKSKNLCTNFASILLKFCFDYAQIQLTKLAHLLEDEPFFPAAFNAQLL